MDWLTLIPYVLTVARLTSLITREDGPFRVFDRIRLLARHIHEELGILFECHYCASVWVAGFTLLAYAIIPQVMTPFFLLMAASMVSILILNTTGGDDDESDYVGEDIP